MDGITTSPRADQPTWTVVRHALDARTHAEVDVRPVTHPMPYSDTLAWMNDLERRLHDAGRLMASGKHVIVARYGREIYVYKCRTTIPEDTSTDNGAC